MTHRVKVTLEQERQLQRMAAQQRLSVSRLLVETTLAREEGWTPMQRRALMTGWLGARRDLAGVATNVNQIAHWCNAEQRFTRDAERLVANVDDAIARLQLAIEELCRP